MCSHACRLCLSAALKFMSINTWGLNHRTGAVNITKQWMILKVTSSTANYHIQKFPGNFYVFKKHNTQHSEPTLSFVACCSQRDVGEYHMFIIRTGAVHSCKQLINLTHHLLDNLYCLHSHFC